MTVDDQITRVLDQFDRAEKFAFDDGFSDKEWRFSGLAVYQRNTRLFRRGDLVIVVFTNGGGERWPVYGRSSRGRDVGSGTYCHYEQGHRYRDGGEWRVPKDEWSLKRYPNGFRASKSDQYSNKSTVRIVDVPKEIRSTGSESASARVRRWLADALRAGCAARGVGSGSPALLLPFQADEAPPRARRKKSPKRIARQVMW